MLACGNWCASQTTIDLRGCEQTMTQKSLCCFCILTAWSGATSFRKREMQSSKILSYFFQLAFLRYSTCHHMTPNPPQIHPRLPLEFLNLLITGVTGQVDSLYMVFPSTNCSLLVKASGWAPITPFDSLTLPVICVLLAETICITMQFLGPVFDGKVKFTQAFQPSHHLVRWLDPLMEPLQFGTVSS